MAAQTIRIPGSGTTSVRVPTTTVSGANLPLRNSNAPDAFGIQVGQAEAAQGQQLQRTAQILAEAGQRIQRRQDSIESIQALSQFKQDARDLFNQEQFGNGGFAGRDAVPAFNAELNSSLEKTMNDFRGSPEAAVQLQELLTRTRDTFLDNATTLATTTQLRQSVGAVETFTQEQAGIVSKDPSLLDSNLVELDKQISLVSGTLDDTTTEALRAKNREALITTAVEANLSQGDPTGAEKLLNARAKDLSIPTQNRFRARIIKLRADNDAALQEQLDKLRADQLDFTKNPFGTSLQFLTKNNVDFASGNLSAKDDLKFFQAVQIVLSQGSRVPGGSSALSPATQFALARRGIEVTDLQAGRVPDHFSRIFDSTRTEGISTPVQEQAIMAVQDAVTQREQGTLTTALTGNDQPLPGDVLKINPPQDAAQAAPGQAQDVPPSPNDSSIDDISSKLNDIAFRDNFDTPRPETTLLELGPRLTGPMATARRFMTELPILGEFDSLRSTETVIADQKLTGIQDNLVEAFRKSKVGGVRELATRIERLKLETGFFKSVSGFQARVAGLSLAIEKTIEQLQTQQDEGILDSSALALVNKEITKLRAVQSFLSPPIVDDQDEPTSVAIARLVAAGRVQLGDKVYVASTGELATVDQREVDDGN